MVKLIISIFYLGFLPYAPGTFGSIATVFMGYWLQQYGGFPLLLGFTVASFFLGWILTHQYLKTNMLTHDPQEIVIDELVGQLIAYLPISLYSWIFGLSIFSNSWAGWLLALILFRTFDIWKPWPVRWADRKTSALGVMLDDVLAGLYAASVITIFIVFRPGGTS